MRNQPCRKHRSTNEPSCIAWIKHAKLPSENSRVCGGALGSVLGKLEGDVSGAAEHTPGNRV